MAATLASHTAAAGQLLPLKSAFLTEWCKYVSVRNLSRTLRGEHFAAFYIQLTLALADLIFTAYEQLTMTETDNIATNKVTSLDVDVQGGLDQRAARQYVLAAGCVQRRLHTAGCPL